MIRSWADGREEECSRLGSCGEEILEELSEQQELGAAQVWVTRLGEGVVSG